MTPIRLLLIQSNPPDSAYLAIDVEQRNLQDVIAQSAARRSLQVHGLPAARIGDLPAYLRRHAPHIVHFACHGDGDGGLRLNALDDATSAVIGAAELAAIVRAYQAEAPERLRLAVLAGCWTEETARLLANEVDWTVGFGDKVPDAHLVTVFTPQFYAALGDGRSAPNAMETACSVLRGCGFDDTAQMVRTFVRRGVQPADLTLAAWLPSVLSPAHLDYLKLWFAKPWANIPLADILERDDGDAQQVSLLDVYVPLPVDFGLALQTQGGEIVDWWADVEGERVAERAALETAEGAPAEQQKPPHMRAWPALGVGEAELELAVAEIQRKMDLRRSAGETMDDGEHAWTMEAHDAASVQSRFVLLGEPGSGKSSFLRHLALCQAGEMRRRAGDAGAPVKAGLAALRDWLLEPPYTPIYVELRDLVAAAFPALPANEDDPPRLPEVEHFWNYIAAQVAGPELSRLGGELRSLCDAGRAILLLDGLDEVPQGDSKARRKQMQGLIGALARRYPQLRIVVASRPHAYRRGEWALAGFGVAELRPLSLGRLTELAQALFPAVLGDEGGSQANAFIQAVELQLKDKRIERSFYANPLFFTLLAGLWLAPEGGRKLPQTRPELYRRSVDLLLARWTRRRLPADSVAERLALTPAQLRGVMETLAGRVHEQSAPGQDSTHFHVKELLSVLYEAGRTALTPAVIDHLSRQTGLLTAPETKWLYFTHRSFQEHLAACELICEKPDAHLPPVAAERRFPAGIVQRLHQRPELWENVARLAADELAAKGRGRNLGELLAAVVRPYLESGEAPAAVTLALSIAREQKLFAVDADDLNIAHKDFETLRRSALKLLVDWEQVEPEERNVAGELLGLRPEHDTRRGVGLRSDGLPDIDWVEAPEVDATGQCEFIYQEGERRREPTFWMARYPITYRQFQAFVDAEDGYRDRRWWTGLDAPDAVRKGPDAQRFPFWNHPRENVSWYASVAFCRWLTAQAADRRDLLPPALRRRGDWRISLPTEWQWEKAARGHDGRRYPWGGDAYRSGYANIGETVQNDERKAVGVHYLQKSSAVGMYPQGASPGGICDLSGNVWEWCLNEYDNPERVQEAGDERRVLRGGSWNSSDGLAAAVARFGNSPSAFSAFNGLRVVVCAVPVE